MGYGNLLSTKGLKFRANQLVYLSGKIHELSTGDDFSKKLEATEEAGSDISTGRAMP